MKRVLVSFLDPAESGDPAANVVCEGTYPEKKVYVRIAKQFKDHKVVRNHRILAYLDNLKRKINPHIMAIERNKQGNEFAEFFEIRGLSLQRISTSAGITEETASKGYSMDKPATIGRFKIQKNKHNIIFSDTPTLDMQELIDQIPKIISIHSPGHIIQRAHRGQHDDLFICLLHCFNLIELWWKKCEALDD